MGLLRVTVGSVLAVVIILSVDPAFGQGAPRDPNDYFKCFCQACCDLGPNYRDEVIDIARLFTDKSEIEYLAQQLRDGSKGKFESVEYSDLIDGFCPLNRMQRDGGFRSVADTFINRQAECCGSGQDELCNMYNSVLEALIPYLENRLVDGTCKTF